MLATWKRRVPKRATAPGGSGSPRASTPRPGCVAGGIAAGDCGGSTVLGPGDVLTLAVVFTVPSGHNAAAYLVVLNSFTVARRWLRSAGRWSETRKLIVPDQEAA